MKRVVQFQQEFAPYFKEVALSMASPETIRFEDLPESILDRYANKERSEFLVTVFPSGNIWKNAVFMKRFSHDLQQTSPKATGMPVVFKALIEVIGSDGRRAMGLTLVVVFVLLMIDFRRVSDSFLAMLPLVSGMVWMVGVMYLCGVMFTVMNVMALPMILGIGIDDGVHVVHRWRREGKGSLFTVFASTGKAILLTTLTTMLAFGSLIFSVYPAFASLGSAMFIGVGCCFLVTVFLLSALIQGADSSKK